MNDWSGFATASSLPAETLQRMALNAKIVEHSLQTPQPSFSESFASRQNGVPVVAESLAGGAVQVSVNSFSRFQPSGRVVEPIDNWDRNHVAHQQFHEFFTGYVRGQVPVRESLPSYSRPPGPVSYGGTNRQKRRPSGIPLWYQSLPGEPSIDPSKMMRRSHPSYTFAGFNRDGQEVYRGEDGGVVVDGNTALDDDGSEEEEEEEERQRIKRKYLEAVAGSTPVRESGGWHWCSVHQKWTRN